MPKLRSRLLITLALLGVLALASSSVRADLGPQRMGVSGPAGNPMNSSIDPNNAGEPDVGQTSMPHNTATNGSSAMSQRGAEAGSPSRVSSFALVIRMARVFWMARYFGIAP